MNDAIKYDFCLETIGYDKEQLDAIKDMSSEDFKNAMINDPRFLYSEEIADLILNNERLVELVECNNSKMNEVIIYYLSENFDKYLGNFHNIFLLGYILNRIMYSKYYTRDGGSDIAFRITNTKAYKLMNKIINHVKRCNRVDRKMHKKFNTLFPNTYYITIINMLRSSIHYNYAEEYKENVKTFEFKPDRKFKK